MKKQYGGCETCTYYTYDEEYECYVCDVNMDEDEYCRLLSNKEYQCPYWRDGNEYAVVKKQM
ncbi:MAG: DUF6472 family protein [Lachnospiraceae bacterium]|nr:DUF6472 family protein [Lachnospiraceae bacterium]